MPWQDGPFWLRYRCGYIACPEPNCQGRDVGDFRSFVSRGLSALEVTLALFP
jgi:hypothetical protein